LSITNPWFGKKIKKSLTKSQISLQFVTFVDEDGIYPCPAVKAQWSNQIGSS
jgi:hypothetical protein